MQLSNRQWMGLISLIGLAALMPALLWKTEIQSFLTEAYNHPGSLMFLLAAIVSVLLLVVSPLVVWRLHVNDKMPLTRNEGRHSYKLRLEVDYNWILREKGTSNQSLDYVGSVVAKKSYDVQWAELYSSEKILVMQMPPAILRLRWSHIVTSFENVASPAEIEAARAQRLLDAPPTEAGLRDATAELVDRLQRYRRIIVRREAIKNGVTFVVALFAFLFFVSFFIAYILYSRPFDVPVLSVIVAFGALGGFVSSQARIQAIPETGTRTSDLSLLRLATGILLAIVSGAIGALMINILFAGGVIEGDLFPTINSPASAFVDVKQFLAACKPGTNADMAKIVAWAFAAGFTERLVPDQVFFLVSQLPGRGEKP